MSPQRGRIRPLLLVGGALLGLLLFAFGYVAAAEGVAAVQPDQAIQGIRLLISILPAGVAVMMFIAFLYYKLDEEMTTRIQKDLEARRTEESGSSLQQSE
jgi:glycoside/pentoside/hexuronide:cation symporter, GPH family